MGGEEVCRSVRLSDPFIVASCPFCEHLPIKRGLVDMKPKRSLFGDLFNLDVLFGILVGIAVPFSILIGMGEGIKAWQDLTAGILGVLGGAGAVIGVMYQIRHAQETEDERRERQMYAARSMMPHALASICEYAELCAAQLRAVVGEGSPPKDPDRVTLPARFDLPRVSELPLSSLEQLLQFGDSPIQDRLSTLMDRLQIQQSRIANRSGHVVDNAVFARWYYTLIVDTLELHARASALFHFARRETDLISDGITQQSFYSAAQQCGFGRPGWEAVAALISERLAPD